ncbi:hypothetical protein JCM21900_003965 [Sporobolomyces salmonicolor]
MTSDSPHPSESYAVIGGEGFLGAALVSELLAHHPTSSASRSGAIRRNDNVARGLAACECERRVWQKVNVEGTRVVVEACRQAGVRKLVFTSSATVVFEGEALKDVDGRIPTVDVEGEKGEPTYVSTKAKAGKIVLDANGKDGLLTCSLRLSGIIGPGDRQAIPGFIAVHKSGQSAFQMGANQNLFDFVTVRNVVHAHLLAAERLDAPPVVPSTFEGRLPPVACTVKRRRLPTSAHPEVSFRAALSP